MGDAHGPRGGGLQGEETRAAGGHGSMAWGLQLNVYRGASLIRNLLPLGLYGRHMPSPLGLSQGGGAFLMSKVPL